MLRSGLLYSVTIDITNLIVLVLNKPSLCNVCRIIYTANHPFSANLKYVDDPTAWNLWNQNHDVSVSHVQPLNSRWSFDISGDWHPTVPPTRIDLLLSWRPTRNPCEGAQPRPNRHRNEEKWPGSRATKGCSERTTSQNAVDCETSHPAMTRGVIDNRSIGIWIPYL